MFCLTDHPRSVYSRHLCVDDQRHQMAGRLREQIETSSARWSQADAPLCQDLCMTKTSERVTVWTHGSSDREWTKEEFEDLGHGDLTRVYLGWFAGSGPGARDMVEHNVIESQIEASGETMTDTQTFLGSGVTPEVDKGQAPLLLGAMLSGQARKDGELYIYRSPRSLA